MFRVVIDTNVVFEGLSKGTGASARLMKAWLDKAFVPCVTIALSLEYEHVLSKFSIIKRQTALMVLRELLRLAEPVQRHVRYRPRSPDPADDHVIECVMNGMAALCTRNVKDFAAASRDLGFEIFTPEKLAIRLTQ